MRLIEKQWAFSRAVTRFLVHAYMEIPGLDISVGDFWAREGHMPRSTHYSRLGMDLNFFLHNKWLRTYEDSPATWEKLGTIWESQHKFARWGGRFKNKDLNHFSFENEGYA